MSIKVNFYNNASENNVLDKSLTLIASVDCLLKDQCSIIEPVLLINANLSDFAVVNFCVITAFNRSYFVDNIVSVKNNLLEIHCSVDVLYTYRNQIRTLTGMLARSQSNGNGYVRDNLPILQTGSPSEVINYDAIEDYCYILAVTGSGEDETSTESEETT